MVIVTRQQRVADMWVELLASQFYQFSPNFDFREGFAIGPVGSHGVNRIREHDDSRPERYVATFKSIRIASTVPVLVMMSDRRDNILKV